MNRSAADADPGFRPALGLGGSLLQSVLASKRPARALWRRRGLQLDALSHFHELDCGDGVRLTGVHTPSSAPGGARGLAVLIHGWEGSHDSSYLYSMACTLHREGYAVFRLNLRDHGGSYHLNEEMFHSARMGEVLGAIRAAQALDTTQPLFVIGFSLGGNFALRVGLQGPAAGVTPRLSIGISPAIHPRHTLEAIDTGPVIFNRYFLEKWRLTMDLKAEAWPGRYDFTPHKQIGNFIEITRRFVGDFTDFATLDDYFERYTLTPDMLMSSPSPLAVITSADDSVIPIADFAGLSARGSVLAYDLCARGGHCGFISNWALDSWAEKRVLQLLETA